MSYLLHDVFTKSVKLFPENIAIASEQKEEITYSRLNALSNQFAHLFQKCKKNIQETPYIGILSSVHNLSIASVLGALKIGCAYVPLDEFSPVERLRYIIENTKLDLIVVDGVLYENFRELFQHPHIKFVIVLNQVDRSVCDKTILYDTVLEQKQTEISYKAQVSDNLAYILHSSGSTGVPKGIMLTHRNARTFVDWMHKEFVVSAHDIIMSRAPFKFDLSIFDIFNTFKAGAKLVCFDWTVRRKEPHKDYVDLMKEKKATILYTTPSTFISLMNRGGLKEAKVGLRTIMYAGEPFPVPQLRKLKQCLPSTRIANIYGPSETNIITYYWIDRLPDDDTSIPLGVEVDDTEIVVVKEDGKTLCGYNEVGELWCRGGTVTLGYLGLEEKTKECLVQSPFHQYPAYFWRTGDFGYRDREGRLHYRGRRDHMVKVKGYRIEIGEVESALSQHNFLDEFVIVAVPDEKYSNRLYCHYTTLKENIDAKELEGFLKKKLPSYMVPYKFIKHQTLPKTSSGKVDRVLLAQEAL